MANRRPQEWQRKQREHTFSRQAALIFGLLCCVNGGLFASKESESRILGTAESDETRVCLSLRVLSTRVTDALASNRPIPDECLNLAGLSYVEGYLIDQESPKDVILYGLRSKKRPGLSLDDLIVNIRAVVNAEHPYCSLDPTRESTIALQRLFASSEEMNSLEDMKALFEKVKSTVGPQETLIGGVPRNSRHAHVMIEADYHMKRVSQGHITIDDVKSCLDRSLSEAAGMIKKGEPSPAAGVSMARFWFHIEDGAPTFQEGTNIVAIEDCNVVILTEKQKATASGELVDVLNEDDHQAMAFAREMSDYLSTLDPVAVPIYADLIQLYRLRALLLSMEFKDAFESIGWSFATFCRKYKYQNDKLMPPSLPGLANYKEWTYEASRGPTVYQYMLFPIVCGGVGQDMTVEKESFREQFASRLFSFCIVAILERPSQDVLAWEVQAPFDREAILN